MAQNDEAVFPPAEHPPTHPGPAGGGASPTPTPAPTPAAVLAWVAAAGGQPWFPSRHAADTNTDRNALDDPLWQLRLAGLVKVATWVRGAGQGFILTPDGEKAAATGVGIPGTEKAPDLLPDQPPPAIPDLAPEERVVTRLGLDTRAPFLVPLLLVANVFWFGAGIAAAARGGHPIGGYLGSGNPYLLHRLGAVSGADLLDGEWWRLLSSCFVHIGLLHLCANMFALAMVGPLAELLWGRWRLAAIYAVSGLAGSCLAMALRPEALLAGASGAIWGVLASLVAWLVLFRSRLPSDVVRDWGRRLGIVFLINAGVSAMPGISWEAHLGGGVTGFLTAALLNVVRHAPRWQRLLAAALFGALPVLCVGGLLWAMDRGRAWDDLRAKIADREAEEARQAEVAEQRARQDATRSALQTFLRETTPRVTRLGSDIIIIWPGQIEAVVWSARAREGRDPDAVARSRQEITKQKADADAMANQLAVATGVVEIDLLRAKARMFADAQSRSLGLLLAMLDSPAPPDDAAWAKWGKARRAADALWRELQPR